MTHIGGEEMDKAELGEEEHDEVRGPGQQPGQHHHRAHHAQPLHCIQDKNLVPKVYIAFYLFSFLNQWSNIVFICFLGAELEHGHIVVPAEIKIIDKLMS